MKIWEKWKALIIFAGLSVLFIGIGIYYHTKDIFKNKDIWEFLSVIDTATAIALAILAAMAYWELAKGEDDIELKFEFYEEKNGKRIVREIKDFKELTGERVFLLRKNITRAEIQGILGAFKHKSEKRYEIPTKDSLIIIKRTNEIRKGKGKEMLIPITKENYEKHFLGKGKN